MAATKRSMNWSAVGFTPTSGSPIALGGVTSVEYDPQINVNGFSGDGDRYMTTKVVDMQDPKFTVVCADIAAALSIPVNVRGTLTATHNDAKNGTGAGAITYTMSNAILTGRPTTGAHRQYGSVSLVFESESSDGQTNPVSTSTT